MDLFGLKTKFAFPKPEGLIRTILEAASDPGDLIFDSFLGSGTTAAVAQKMNRRYIGIEMGDHAVTHCVPRMRKVVDGEQGGISEAVGWKGGGGFRFYRLGPRVFDEDGKLYPGIRFEHLAAHIWFSETRTPLPRPKRLPLLGIDKGTAYFLLYNGVLGDKRPNEEVRQRIGPSVVVELTATPKEASNVLYRGTAGDLKDDQMIKLPVVLTEHNTNWQDAVREAVRTREKLATLAGNEREYVRPLLLIQAQNAGQEADWKAVRQHLLETEGLAGEEIAVHTGDKRELDGVDLFSPTCPVTTIITVQALKEGWDCSFAYVLCSTANIGVPGDVEQLLAGCSGCRMRAGARQAS